MQPGIYAPPPGFDPISQVVRGVRVHDRASGQVAAHLVRIGDVPSSPSLPTNAVGAAASVINLGVSVASFVYMRAAFKRTERALSGIAEDLDALSETLSARHRAAVIADLEAVLDALALADGLAEPEQRTLMLANFVPALKALKLYGAFAEEVRDEATKGRSGAFAQLVAKANERNPLFFVETGPALADYLAATTLAAALEIKLYSVLGQAAQASERAVRHSALVGEAVQQFAAEWRGELLVRAAREGTLAETLPLVAALLGRDELDVLTEVWAEHAGEGASHGRLILADREIVGVSMGMQDAGASEREAHRFISKRIEAQHAALEVVGAVAAALPRIVEQRARALGLLIETELAALSPTTLVEMLANDNAPLETPYVVVAG